MGILTGKRALIVGIASKRSIAAGVAEAMAAEGAELAFTYQNEKLQSRLEEIVQELGGGMCLPMDVASDEEIESTFAELGSRWENLDILIHAVGYAPREQLLGGYLESVTREGSQIAHDISSYSFAALAKAARPMLAPNASLVTLTYLGAVRTIPHYNVMGPAKASLEANVRFMAADLGPEGIRVNGISAGPIKTLAASGIKDFRKMLLQFEKLAPLRRNVTIRDVGNAAAFLSSDLAGGITGEILYVDCGYNIVGITGG
jgi:enoyl-[acyl-carrier protein] reductase I